MKLLLMISLYGCFDAPSRMITWECKNRETTDRVYAGCKKQLYGLRQYKEYKPKVVNIESRCMEHALRSSCKVKGDTDLFQYIETCGNAVNHFEGK